MRMVSFRLDELKSSQHRIFNLLTRAENYGSEFRQYRLPVSVVSVLLLAISLHVVYNLYFHPLAAYPGPFLARATHLWRDASLLRGRAHFDVQRAHQKYGNVVRIAPDELSYTKPDVWKDVFGHRPGKGEVPKSRDFYDANAAGSDSVFGAYHTRHGELRRLLSHGFSEKALRAQETIIQGYADLLIKRLYEHGNQGQTPLDVGPWFNFFAFDVIGDLTFGEPFGSLQQSKYHPWIETIIGDLKSFAILAVVNQYKMGRMLADFLIPAKALEDRKANFMFAKEKAMKRQAMTEERPDFLNRMTKPGAVSEREYIANALSLIGPGSETTATLLTGAVYYLLKNPATLQKLTDEIRGSFSSPEDITFIKLGNLKYLAAVLDESLRLYPPVPGGLPRRTDNDELICGQHVPRGTRISVYHWAIYRSEDNFTRPNDFVPERWLGDPEFEHDSKMALQPFNYGPRACLGKNLAYCEMRLVLAKLLYYFGLEAADDYEGWTDQNVFFVWYKGPVRVKLHPVRKLSI